MLFRKILLFLFTFCTVILFPLTANAIENPLSRPNNKFGVHILFPSELNEAAKLVNSSGGDWGYITIPIQANDKDLTKWQTFMDEAKKYHLIPIIRLATNGDYFNTAVWQKPTYAEVMDFANFLNSLKWPTQNRYVIIYNEVNRADEWGGSPNPSEYAQILSYAVTIFKSENKDFFIISAGLDNGADNYGGNIDQYYFMQLMNESVPGIFNQIDGIASHSYPNPGFNQPPWVITKKSIHSFKYEQAFTEQLASKKLPVFITETGWSGESVSDSNIASYFKTAFSSTWSDPSIIAVTPFLLRAETAPFLQFSFLQGNNANLRYKSIKEMPKIKGVPVTTTPRKVLGEKVQKELSVKKFKETPAKDNKKQENTFKMMAKWLLKML